MKGYRKEGFRFYLASQTTADGKPPFTEFSAEAHGIAYWSLIQKMEQGECDVRFVKDGSIIWLQSCAEYVFSKVTITPCLCKSLRIGLTSSFESLEFDFSIEGVAKQVK